MPKPVCVKCQRFFKMKKSGYYFIEGQPWNEEFKWDGKRGKDSIGWSPYKVWIGDLYECPDCHATIVSGFGQEPLSEDYKSNFDEIIKRTNAHQLLVKDC